MKDSEEPKRSVSLEHLPQQSIEPVGPHLNRNTKVVSIFYPGNEKLHPHFDLQGEIPTLVKANISTETPQKFD